MSDPPHEQRGAARSHLPRRGRAKKRNGIPEDPRENSRLSNSSNKTNGHSSGVIFSNSKRLKSSRREVTSNRTNGSGSPSAAIISRNTENYQLASENMERRPHGQNEVSSSSSTTRADHNTRSKNGVRKQVRNCDRYFVEGDRLSGRLDLDAWYDSGCSAGPEMFAFM